MEELWRRKNPAGIPLKPKSIFAIEAEFELEQNSDMFEEERQICINAIRSSRNKGQNSLKSGSFSNYSNNTSYASNQQTEPKKDKKKKENGFNKIKCWFCNKIGHTQIKCKS